MTILHVVAHPDDDLFFCNPDIADALRAGAQVTTVYLTAGDLNGNGDTPSQRARSRQQGICDAYAHMAGLTPAADQGEWDADTPVFAGYHLDRYTLTGTAVEVLFVGLPDGHLASLDTGATLTTVAATGGAGAPAQSYLRADVVGLLADLIELAGPDVVRTLDALPESRYTADHPDHTTAARLAVDAAATVVDPPVVCQYRGYSIAYLPPNLSTTVEADKTATCAAYTPYDHYAAPGNYPARMRHRWPLGAQWATRDTLGRLWAFALQRGRLFAWAREATTWTWPVDLGDPGTNLIGAVAVGHNHDGRLEVFCRTTDHRIVHRWQTTGGGWSPGWGDLGNHNTGAANAAQMGTPLVVANADGRLQILVKNGGGGLSSRWQTAPNGGWGNWIDLGGTDIQDGPTAVLGPGGRIEVFAATRAGITHWYQTSPNGPMVINTALPAMAPASQPHAAVGADGRIRLAYRRAGGDLVITTQTAPNGGWGSPVISPGPAGYGPLVAATDGTIYTTTPTGVVAGPGTWRNLSGPTTAVTLVGADLLAAGDNGRIHHHTGDTWTPLP